MIQRIHGQGFSTCSLLIHLYGAIITLPPQGPQSAVSRRIRCLSNESRSKRWLSPFMKSIDGGILWISGSKKTKRGHQKAFVALLREKADRKDHWSKKLPNGPEINKTTFYSHYENAGCAHRRKWSGKTVQLVCDIWAAHSSCWIRRRLLCGRCLLISSRRTDYLGVVPASAMNRFTQHLRDAVLDQIKSDNIEPSQYENVGAILIFVMNGLSRLLNTDAKLAQKTN